MVATHFLKLPQPGEDVSYTLVRLFEEVYIPQVQAFHQTIGAFVYHDLGSKSNDVVIILLQRRWWSHRPRLLYAETEQ